MIDFLDKWLFGEEESEDQRAENDLEDGVSERGDFKADSE